MLVEPLQEMLSRSRVLVLDFAQIAANTPASFDIRRYFADCEKLGENPRLPMHRQRFNDSALMQSKARFLIGQYGEDRAAMLTDTTVGKEGRTIHMGIDIFASSLENVYAPCNGRIIRSGYEEGFGEYGNYLILQPSRTDYYIFLGHLSNNRMPVGPVNRGQPIGRLGDYTNNENGGWSRHLHLQILKNLPPKGKTPDGYSSRSDFAHKSTQFPNPMDYLPGWDLH